MRFRKRNEFPRSTLGFQPFPSALTYHSALPLGVALPTALQQHKFTPFPSFLDVCSVSLSAGHCHSVGHTYRVGMPGTCPCGGHGQVPGSGGVSERGSWKGGFQSQWTSWRSGEGHFKLEWLLRRRSVGSDSSAGHAWGWVYVHRSI